MLILACGGTAVVSHMGFACLIVPVGLALLGVTLVVALIFDRPGRA